jgi:hypothetical protein
MRDILDSVRYQSLGSGPVSDPEGTIPSGSSPVDALEGGEGGPPACRLPRPPRTREWSRAYDAGPTAAIKLETFRRIIAFSREVYLANDFVSFAQLVDALGVAAAAREADTVYTLLASNPVMVDGAPLFSAAHQNLMPGATLDATSLATACAALTAQTDVNGNALHLSPRFLTTGVDLAPEARALTVPTMPTTGAAEAGALTPIVEPRITDRSWYVTASPSEAATLVTVHLSAEPSPTLEARDGVGYRQPRVQGSRGLRRRRRGLARDGEDAAGTVSRALDAHARVHANVPRPRARLRLPHSGRSAASE